MPSAGHSARRDGKMQGVAEKKHIHDVDRDFRRTGGQMKRRIDVSKLRSAQQMLERGVRKYLEILERYHTFGCADAQFQRLFTGFFRVRRDETWRAAYYRLFAKYAEANDGLFLLLWDIHSATGRVEASFASKILALIDPDRPIWDKYVLKNLGIKPPAQYLDTGVRIGMICDKMNTIQKAYERLSARQDMVDALAWFDADFPFAREISRMKKMDFLLWAMC